MSIREIIEKIQESFKNWMKDDGQLVKDGAEKVQNTLDQLDGNKAYDEAIKIAIEEIKQHPELAIEILGFINENVSAKVAVEAVKQLPSEEKFSEQIAVNATEQIDFRDGQIVDIIGSDNLGYENKIQIAEQINDDQKMNEVKAELKVEEEQRILNELQQIYMMCDENMNEVALGEKLSEVMESIQIDTMNIQDLKNRIIAKKIAFNYAKYGTNIVSKFRGIMTAKEMYEKGIVQMSKEEYKKIRQKCETIKGDEIKEFNEKELEHNIKKEIEATEKNTEFNEEEVLEKIMAMMKTTLTDKERKELLLQFQEMVGNEKIRTTYQDMRETGVVGLLAELTEDNREKILVMFKNIIDKRLQRKNVAPKTPEIKAYRFNNEDERE